MPINFIREIKVWKLFGLYDHAVTLRSKQRVTVIAGPNGIGKSTILALTRALLRGDMRTLGKHDFEAFAVEMADRQRLTVQPIERHDDLEDSPKRLLIKYERDGKLMEEKEFDALASRGDLALPPYIDQRGPDLFFDQRIGEYVHLDEVEARYGRPNRPGKRAASEQTLWLEEVTQDWQVDFIETKRLDTLIAIEKRHRPIRGRREPETAPIQIYLGEVASRLTAVQRQADRMRQIRDRSFARRLLDKGSKLSVKEPILRERYAALNEEAERLARNGLLTDSLEVLPESKLTPTDKRVLNLFLDDFEEKLKPLRPLSQRVEMLQEVIGSKFLNKRIEIDPSNGVEFYSEPDDRQIAPESLSSGEQHELALISRLLFRENAGTTVLIDEPELSLHVGWQHEMIDDLIEVARVAQLHFVLATHSTAIINGRWDLVKELGPLDPDQPEHS